MCNSISLCSIKLLEKINKLNEAFTLTGSEYRRRNQVKSDGENVRSGIWGSPRSGYE
jgi:hypothetical protein